MLLIVKLALALIFGAGSAWAGGRGGHNTTFDPNSYGGGWTTINCTGSDATTLANWQTAAIAANPATANLRLIGGCVTSNDLGFLSGIQNPTVWGYGATVNRIKIGGGGTSFGTSALIQTVSAGASAVTLTTASDISKVSLGMRVAIAGLELQGTGGFPPNFQFFEYKIITNITGSVGSPPVVISLESPLGNSYLSTWPTPPSAGDGPAALYPMDSSWDTNVKILGLTIADPQCGQVVTTGRNIQLWDMVFPACGVNNPGIAVTISQSVWVFNSQIGSSENDKEVSFLGMINIAGDALNTQSASIGTLLVQGASLSRQMFGTPLNATISGLKTPLLAVGPNGYGAGSSVSIDGSTIASGRASGQFAFASSLTFSSGTFSLPIGDPNRFVMWQMGVPGHKYFRGDAASFTKSTPPLDFTITAVRQDASFIYWDTDIGNSLPSCSANCANYVSYSAATITQKFSGPADLTPFAAP